MNEKDKKILNTVQGEFPLSNRPFLEIGNKLEIDEEEVIERLKSLKEQGYIRRLGGVFDSKALGFKSTLVALRVKPEKIDEIARRINEYPGVTHNYERDDYLNLWFTLVSINESELKKTLNEINGFYGVEKLLNLPAIRLFKIGLDLQLE